MIKTELSYNPYLQEICIRFNGQNPRINSLVEKYQDKILNDWIDKIPKIFHDEMNGYGFDLDFSGTELDYQNLKSSFEKAGVSEEEVSIFFKNELESRLVKVERLERLLAWLNDNPNHLFDYEAFKAINSGTLDDLYIYKILQGEGIDPEALKDEDISIEIISDVEELDMTNLNNIPVLVFITERSLNNLKRNTLYLINRKDVKRNQIFFYIDPLCDSEKIVRTIKDLGVEDPQVVSSIYDESIKAYFELYPITDYICQTIKISHDVIDKIQIELDKQNKNNQVSEKKAAIQAFDKKIQALKKLDDYFINRDNIDVPKSFVSAQNELISELTNWRTRKTVTTKEGEAILAAQEYDALMRNAYGAFWNSINAALIQEEESLSNIYHAMYSNVCVNADYRPSVSYTAKVNAVSLPSVSSELLSMKEEKYELPREGIIDQVFKSGNTNKVMEKITYYYYKDWREHIVKMVTDLSNRAISARVTFLKQYSNELAASYHEQINTLIDKEIENKNDSMSQLSEVEMSMQIDSDWLNSVVEQINAIERG